MIQEIETANGSYTENLTVSMESFFHTLKTGLVHHRDYQTRSQAKADIFDYIEIFYNRSRRHSALGYMTPAQYERIKMAA